jgi:hypothetical protein
MQLQEEEESDDEDFSDTDDESAASSGTESDASESGWSFTGTRLGGFLTAVSGNKVGNVWVHMIMVK